MINEAIAPLQSAVSLNTSRSITGTNMVVQNSNFGASTSRNPIHPVPDQYSSSALTLQCKANDTYSIGVFAYTEDLSEAPFDILSDAQIECTKALLLNSKTSEISSNIHMYGINKASGLPLTFQPDATLMCYGGFMKATNTLVLGALANTFSISNNTTIVGTQV